MIVIVCLLTTNFPIFRNNIAFILSSRLFHKSDSVSLLIDTFEPDELLVVVVPPDVLEVLLIVPE